MNPVPLMVDLSSNNPLPNLTAHWRSGRRVLCLKATEGTGYAWSLSAGLADAWHRLGPDAVVWHYHFLHPGNVASGAAQADYFYAHIAHVLRDGDRAVCDIETKGETGAELSSFWLRYMQLDPHTPRVDYGGPFFLRDNGIRPLHGEALWLAAYGTEPNFIPAGWSHYLAWQYTDRATGVPGVSGAVDQSHLTEAALPAANGPRFVTVTLPLIVAAKRAGTDVLTYIARRIGKTRAQLLDINQNAVWIHRNIRLLDRVEVRTG